MGPFEAGRSAMTAIADIYETVAKFFAKKSPQLRAVFTLLMHEYRTESARVDKWIKRWREEFGDEPPEVDVRQIGALVKQVRGFGLRVKEVEVMEPEAAIGMALSLERELGAALEVRATTIVGGFYNEVAAMSREHSKTLNEALSRLKKA